MKKALKVLSTVMAAGMLAPAAAPQHLLLLRVLRAPLKAPLHPATRPLPCALATPSPLTTRSTLLLSALPNWSMSTATALLLLKFTPTAPLVLLLK